MLELVKQKGVYPYDYMSSFKKFSNKKLPDRCEFLSSLKHKCISEKDYLQAITEISSFYICVPKIMIKWCMAPEIWCTTDRQMDGQKKWHIEVGAPPKNKEK